jgi:bifunctional non-homologous end joining protein LigD
VFSEHAQCDVDCLVADDAESLVDIVGSGAIALPVWASRIGNLAHADWCRLELDAGGAPLARVARVARELEALAAEMGLPSFVVTSGSAGLAVLLPVGGLCTFAETRSLGELVARVAGARLPEIAATVGDGPGRGRVTIDFRPNEHGRPLPAPYSVLPGPRGLVATPLAWDEVDDGLDLDCFTIETVPERMGARKSDPLAAVLTIRPDLQRALALLTELLKG